MIRHEDKPVVVLEELKAEHKAFVLEYIRTGNAVKSYMSIYPNSTYNAAGVSAHQLLKNPEISGYIKQYHDALWDNRNQEIGRLFDTLLKIANADLSDVLISENGKVKVRDLSQIDSSCIQQITQSVTESEAGTKVMTNVRLYDKMRAISELIRILGMSKDEQLEERSVIIIPANRPDDMNARVRQHKEKNGAILENSSEDSVVDK